MFLLLFIIIYYYFYFIIIFLKVISVIYLSLNLSEIILIFWFAAQETFKHLLLLSMLKTFSYLVFFMEMDV